MDAKIYNIRIHRLPIGGSDYRQLCSGTLNQLQTPAIADYRAGDMVLLCDRKNLREFTLRRLSAAVPEDIQRPDRVQLRFYPGTGIQCRCESGNIYTMGDRENEGVQFQRGRSAALRRG